jgi:GDPmannose 4,6-dehydratase
MGVTRSRVSTAALWGRGTRTMSKVALITGIGGQDGAYLAKFLLERGYRVIGQYRDGETPRTERLDELGVTPHVELIALDLFSVIGLRHALEKLRPDEIYNLAGKSSVANSIDHPMWALDVNAVGVARLLEAARLSTPGVRFYQASTSEMFGNAVDTSQDETTPVRPRSPYAVSKAFSHWQTVAYRESYGFFGACGIMFNHESPLRGRQFVTRKITAGLAEVKHGRRDHVALGNLDIQRDWGFAGDYVGGMWLALQRSAASDYVFATGVATPLRRFVELAAAGLDMRIDWRGAGASEIGIDRNTGRTVVAIDPAFFRAADIKATIGDPSRARRELGWRPTVDIEDLVAMMVMADERRLIDDKVTT